jgi:putative toxin-antitoxin system antitoxin component (TIGR02293 family)
MHTHNAASILELANRVFADPTQAQDWLSRPSVQLGGRTPLEMLDSEAGVRRVEELLAQIDDDGRLGIG